MNNHQEISRPFRAQQRKLVEQNRVWNSIKRPGSYTVWPPQSLSGRPRRRYRTGKKIDWGTIAIVAFMFVAALWTIIFVRFQ